MGDIVSPREKVRCNMEEPDIKTLKDIYDIIDKYVKLQEQIVNPTRQGMIDSLSGAQTVAFFEVRTTELQQGDNVFMPWESFRDDDLYRKLPQYQLALRNRGIALAGEKLFEKILKAKRKEQGGE